MGQLRTIEEPLAEIGFQIVAITPDKPQKLAEGRGQHEWSYRLLSDAAMEAARGFGIAFTLDAETVKVYEGYGIDLEESSGKDHHQLPVPAVFVVGTDGAIDFQYVNPDYKVRLSADVVLAAARAAAQ